jgi:hypothetical protein
MYIEQNLVNQQMKTIIEENKKLKEMIEETKNKKLNTTIKPPRMFTDPNIDYITYDVIYNILENYHNRDLFHYMFEFIWFNPEHPENFSIYMANQDKQDVEVYEQKIWKKMLYSRILGEAAAFILKLVRPVYQLDQKFNQNVYMKLDTIEQDKISDAINYCCDIMNFDSKHELCKDFQNKLKIQSDSAKEYCMPLLCGPLRKIIKNTRNATFVSSLDKILEKQQNYLNTYCE